ncbi:NACHT domain-containing protein [Micromonospora violae]|uniref:NACHT domain-containing protein n=1 Tax=Micromonospora violae TaxID=1278207 RepID=UPI0033DD5730
MVGIEASLVSLGRSVTLAALNAWLSRRSSNEPLSQLLESEVPDPFQRRRLERALEQVGDTITARLMHDTDASRLPENERQAAALAVSESFLAAALTRDDLLAAAMSPLALARTVRERAGSIPDHAALSTEALRFYHAMIDETCSVLVTAISAIPGWESQATAYLLRQQVDLSAAVAAALERLPSVTADETPDPLVLYAQSVVRMLDRVESIGFPVSDAKTVRLSDTFVRPDVRVGRSIQPLEWALADHPRLFLHGPAGSGKTSTLLWLAIHAARQSLDGLIRFFNDTLPIYLPLNQPAQTGRHPVPDAAYLADIAVPSFESRQLADLVRMRCESGSALLLVDGLDEVDPESRPIWLDWLVQTAERYPDCRFIVTSRTSPLDLEPLIDRVFATARIEPLDSRSKAALTRQWFAAAGSTDRNEPHAAPTAAAARLTSLVEGNSRLNDLSTTPLMLTLMCALFRERGELPLRGSDLYSEFIDMLVDRRDRVRGIAGARVLPKPEAVMLLQELARFMVNRGLTELPREVAHEIMAQVLPTFARLKIDTGPALDHLIRRSGLLVEPAHGRTRFVHVTLQEYLAARSFIENDELDLLVEHAHDPTWHSTLVLAAGQARPWQGDHLIRELLRRVDPAGQRGIVLAAVIQECVSGMIRLDPKLRQACERLWRKETERHTARVVVQLGGGSARDDLYEWLAENDDLRWSGPVVLSRLRNEHSDTIIIAGDHPPDPAIVVSAVLKWYRLTPLVDRPEVRLEIEGVKVDLGRAS